jgi:hypothetical protein
VLSCVLDSFGSGQGPVVNCYKHDNERSGSNSEVK